MHPQPVQGDDTELLRAIARGDEQALASLYDRYKSILFGLLLRILNSRAEAEDTLQEVFLQVWQRAATFDETRGRAFTWLVTIGRSRAIDRLRTIKSRARAGEEASREAAPDVVSDSEKDAIRSQEAEVVRRALREIPVEQRRLLDMAYFEGLTQTEISERTAVPLGTVKTRMRSAMKKLRELLKNDLNQAVKS